MNKNPVRFIKKKWKRFRLFYVHSHCLRFHFDGKKTLFVIVNSLGGGGAQRVAAVLASELTKRFHVTVVTLYKREAVYEVDDGVEVLRIPWEKIEHQDIPKYLTTLKRGRRPAAAISFMYDANELNLNSAGPGKVICSERNNPIKKAPERFEHTVAQYRSADHVVFQSEAVKSLYPEDVRQHSTILPNPVSVSCAAADCSRNRIVTAGRLHPQKNQKMLIRAFAEFSEDHPDYTLELYGDGDLRRELEDIAAKLGVQDRVMFHGNVDDVCSEIADAEMFVLSSDYEGLSNALLEAMMMGIPCISTACEGSIDVIKSGENGILTPIGDTQALCRAMSMLADDDNLRESIRRAGRETGRLFDKEIVVNQWIDMIEKVIGQ